MAEIRGFIATSLDGYIAASDGGIEWLKPFEKFDYGYDRFIAEIATIVMGRKTYDQLPALGIGWPYPGKPGSWSRRNPWRCHQPASSLGATGWKA